MATSIPDSSSQDPDRTSATRRATIDVVSSSQRLPGTADQRLAAVIGVWTLAIWLPRIWIIPVGDVWELTRIVVSIGLGLGAAVTLFRKSRYSNGLLVGFAIWSIAVWGRTLWNYWSLDNPTDLRLVHTILAAGFFYLAWRVLVIVRRGRQPAPAN